MSSQQGRAEESSMQGPQRSVSSNSKQSRVKTRSESKEKRRTDTGKIKEGNAHQSNSKGNTDTGR